MLRNTPYYPEAPISTGSQNSHMVRENKSTQKNGTYISKKRIRMGNLLHHAEVEHGTLVLWPDFNTSDRRERSDGKYISGGGGGGGEANDRLRSICLIGGGCSRTA